MEVLWAAESSSSSLPDFFELLLLLFFLPVGVGCKSSVSGKGGEVEKGELEDLEEEEEGMTRGAEVLSGEVVGGEVVRGEGVGGDVVVIVGAEDKTGLEVGEEVEVVVVVVVVLFTGEAREGEGKGEEEEEGAALVKTGEAETAGAVEVLGTRGEGGEGMRGGAPKLVFRGGLEKEGGGWEGEVATGDFKIGDKTAGLEGAGTLREVREGEEEVVDEVVGGAFCAGGVYRE